jgi:hypothetical protein
MMLREKNPRESFVTSRRPQLCFFTFLIRVRGVKSFKNDTRSIISQNPVVLDNSNRQVSNSQQSKANASFQNDGRCFRLSVPPATFSKGWLFVLFQEMTLCVPKAVWLFTEGDTVSVHLFVNRDVTKFPTFSCFCT